MIEVNQELIEKYHRQACSHDECAAVEAWLFEEDTDVALQLPAEENKAIHKAEIWKGILTLLPPKDLPMNKKIRLPYRFIAAAACFIAGLFLLFSPLKKAHHKQTTDLIVDNSTIAQVEHLEYEHCNFAIGPNTRADINYSTGLINLSGSILIHPKEDLELFLSGDAKKTVLKMGQTYILIRDNTENNQLLVVNKSNLTDLPPLVQRKIINTFNI